MKNVEYRHLGIEVHSDKLKDGDSLYDAAIRELNNSIKSNERVISINELYDIREITPDPSNPETWFYRRILKLSVYIEVEILEL